MKAKASGRNIAAPAQETPYFLRNGGVLGDLMQQLDWSQCALGAPCDWSPTLQAIVNLILHSPTPAFLAWGDDLSMLYNDAYLPILGDKHPAALGRPLPAVWPEIWPEIEGYFQAVLKGEAVSFEDLPFTLRRHEADELAWFSFAYTPLTEPDGKVAGLYCSLQETTAKVVAEKRRQEHERDLEQAARRAEQEHQRLAALLQAAPVGISFADPQGKIIASSAENQRLWGQHPFSENVDQYHEWKGWWADGSARHGQRVAPDQWGLARALRGEEVLHDVVEIEPFDSPGTRKTVLLTASPVRNGKGEIINAVVAQIDISERVRVMQAFQDSEARFRTITDVMPQMVWSTDASGYCDYYNQRWYAYTGATPESAIGNGWNTLVHPDDQAPVFERWQQAVATRMPYEAECRLRHVDGRYRWVLVRALPVQSQDGQVLRWLGTSTDIHEQKLAEEALARSESKFRRLVESGVIGIVEYHMRGELKQVNDAFLHIVGYSREEYERDGLSWRQLTPVEWHGANEKALDQLRLTGRMENFVKEYFRKDGSRATVYMGAANFEGTAEEGIAYILDISRLKDAEHSLQESEGKFRAITEALPQIVWSADAAGMVDYCNQRWYDFSGLSEGITFGNGWRDTLHPADRNQVLDAWLHSLGSGEPFEMEYRLLHRSGEYRWLLGRAVAVRDGSGKVLRWMGTCTEIQEQKLTQQALQQSDRQKDEFLAMLAHELRNPLAPIVAGAQLLQLGRSDATRVQELGAVIARQAHHMTGLIDDLLDVSRVTRGLIELGNDPISIGELVAETVEQTRPLMKAKGHELQLHLSSDDAWLAGDRKRLIQVLANLLGNAARYTPANGNIVLQTAIDDAQVTLTVCDNGIGMSEDLRSRVFELFTQGERSADRADGGLGIGLALVKKLTELHGGSVSAESEGPGRGSKFTVRLPRFHPEREKEASIHSATIQPVSRALPVMIVDDNVDAAKVLGMYLEALGHTAAVEHSPSQALARAAQLLPRVCLLDIGLPEFNGYVLAERLRAIPGMEDAVLIATTGYGQPEDREKARAAGFDHHLVKPVDNQALLALLAEVAKR